MTQDRAARVKADIDRATRDIRWPDHLYPCANPLCDRKVERALYCCHTCTLAHEGAYEIHEDGPLGHTSQCNERHAQRQLKR